MKMKPITIVLLTLFIGLTMACGGGGGGSKSPAAPPPPPVMQVSGSWSGLWFENRGLVLAVVFDLSQSASTVSGTVGLIIDRTLYVNSIEGRVDGAIFSWQAVPPAPTCDTMDSPGMQGDSMPNPTQMDGRMRLDGRGCGELFFGGRVIVDRDSGSSSGSSQALIERTIDVTGNLGAAAEALERLEP